jgi:hypothetical protein
MKIAFRAPSYQLRIHAELGGVAIKAQNIGEWGVPIWNLFRIIS